MDKINSNLLHLEKQDSKGRTLVSYTPVDSTSTGVDIHGNKLTGNTSWVDSRGRKAYSTDLRPGEKWAVVDNHPVIVPSNNGFLPRRPIDSDGIEVLPDLVVAAKAPEKTFTQGYHTYVPTDANINHAIEQRKIGENVEQVAGSEKMFNVITGMNAMSPSQLVGFVTDKDLWNGDFMGAFLDYYINGNSGLFTDDYAKKHPNLALAGNMAGDVIVGLLTGAGKAPTRASSSYSLTDRYKDMSYIYKNAKALNQKFFDIWRGVKHPKDYRHFMENYGVPYTDGSREVPKYSINQIKRFNKELDDLYKRTGVKLEDGYNLQGTIDYFESKIPEIEKLETTYKQELKAIEKHSPVLKQIAETSSQYQKQIYDDIIFGRANNIEKYVKDLIYQANTHVRRMRLPEFNENSFTTLSGKSMDIPGSTADVGNIRTVFESPFSKGYGNIAGVYTPKKLNLTGPVETWWEQRMPTFKDPNVRIKEVGMHTDSGVINKVVYNGHDGKSMIPGKLLFNFIYSKIPREYGRTASHTVFNSPNSGANIGDYFQVTPFKNDATMRFSLGYAHGGKLFNNKNK